VSDIKTWLCELKLEKYFPTFVEAEIEYSDVSHLSEDDLKELGLPLGPRKRILASIENISKMATEDASSMASAGIMTPAPIQAERRQVTILFADIVGYTKMTSEVDAKEIHNILGKYFDAVDSIIHEFGGTVDKHVGDSVMAVFGAPTAHSDDPSRAARAALAIHNAMPEVSNLAGRELKVHIGIANGQVVASGVGGDAHYTVTGESVNLASRLTDSATQGESLLSQGIQRALSSSFELKDRGELTVKGIEEPVRAYLLIGLRSAPEIRDGRPFIGRQAERQQITGIFKACSETGAGQVVYLRGEAGIGKTRLTEELEQIAGRIGFKCHRALVLDFGVSREQDAINTLVRSLLSIPAATEIEVRIEAVRHICSNGPLDMGQTVYLNDILGIPQTLELRSLYDAMDNAQRNQGKRETVAVLIDRLSSDCPLFLLVEDIHWADEAVLGYLMEITRSIVNHPVILVMTSRIEGDPLDQSWRSQTAATPLATIDLRPLRHEDAMAFAADYLDATTKFAQSCIKRADGNPLFLEQLLRSAEEVGENQVPGSVQSIVQARLDNLEGVDKQAIQMASVLGQRFSLDALRHLIKNQNYSCKSLIEHFLVRPEGDDFLFSHALLREAVYSSLLKAHSEGYHRAAAVWYGEQEPVLRAKHLDRANDTEAASAYLEASKVHATDLRYDSALELVDRGLELAETADTKCDLFCLRGEVLRNLGETDASIAAFETALKNAADDTRKCSSWIGLAEGLRIADKQELALEVLDKAEAAATKNELLAECANIHYLRGNIYFPMGNIDGCLAEHEKSLALSRKIGSTEGEALSLGGLGDAYYQRGNMRTACEQFQACVKVCHEQGYGRIEVANRSMVGWSRIHLMEFDEAREDGLAAVDMAREVNHRRAELIGLQLVGFVELELGNLDEGKDYLERSLEIARMIGTNNFTAQSLHLLARLYLAQGQIAKARILIKEAEGLVRKVGMTFIGPSVLAVKAALSDNSDERQSALAEAEGILESGCLAHNYNNFANVSIDLHLELNKWNEVERQTTWLETRTSEHPLTWSDFMIARGRSLAAFGRGERNDELTTEITRLRKQASRAGMKLVLPAFDSVLAAE
jgi:class 3 adenylate cyclase/tetratricopeptide (TPR) repeat protein